jgi:hypothetical protein
MKTCKACGKPFKAAHSCVIGGRVFKIGWYRKYCTKCVPPGSRFSARGGVFKCVKCGVPYTFQNRTRNYSTMTTCSQCTRTLRERKLKCRHCHKPYVFARKGGRHYCTQELCHVCVGRKQYLKRKRMAVEYKGGACQECGYHKCLNSLVFHHRNPKNKEHGIQHLLSRRVCWERMRRELDKCDLLCANCHGETHEDLFD